MKTTVLLLALIPGVAALEAQTSDTDSTAPKPQYASLTPAYRKHTAIPETYISPFRKPEARAAQLAALNASRAQGPNLPAVHGRLRELKVTGVIPSTAKKGGVLLLGDHIYAEGDEILLPGSRGVFNQPLLEGHRIILRSVTIDTVVLRVGARDGSDDAVAVDLSVADLLGD